MLDTIKERQEYYEYGGTSPYRMKEAPALNPELAEALKRERLDKKYRFVWGGLVLVREEPNSETFTIARGDRHAGYDCHGVFMPKYIFARATQARGYCYYDELNHKVDGFTREELAPPDKIARIDFRYVDFGILRWFLEQRTSGKELVETSVYDANEVVPEAEWIALSPFAPMETRAGRYYEPGLEMIEVLQKREWENRNANLKDVARAQMQRSAKDRLEKEEKLDRAGKEQWDQLYDDVSKRVEKQTAYLI